jgi:hypothetical protein
LYRLLRNVTDIFKHKSYNLLAMKIGAKTM